MSQLLTLRQAVIDQIKAALGAPWSVEGHLGRFTAAELSKFMTQAPAVRVSVLGLMDTADLTDEEGAVLDGKARLGIYVVTRDGTMKLSRDEAAIAAVERISLLAAGQRWGLPFCRPALPATAQNLYSDDTLGKGVAFWGIDLAQPVQLSIDTDAAGDPLTALYVGIAPDVGPSHIADYIGPFPEADADA